MICNEVICDIQLSTSLFNEFILLMWYVIKLIIQLELLLINMSILLFYILRVRGLLMK